MCGFLMFAHEFAYFDLRYKNVRNRREEAALLVGSKMRRTLLVITSNELIIKTVCYQQFDDWHQAEKILAWSYINEEFIPIIIISLKTTDATYKAKFH